MMGTIAIAVGTSLLPAIEDANKKILEDDMTNQLIQDPEKLKKRLVQMQEEKQPATLVEQHGTWIVTPTNPVFVDFKSIGFDRGTKVWSKLNEVHENLLSILSTADNSIIDTDKIKKLESEVYAQGISLLKQTLETAKQITGTDNTLESLKSETTELQDELTKASSETLKNLIKQRIEVNSRNINTVKKASDRVDELLCQTELCIDSIREICLTLPELIVHKPKDEMDKVLIELNSRMEYAQRIKEEYVKQGL
jgi:hypothetical protein